MKKQYKTIWVHSGGNCEACRAMKGTEYGKDPGDVTLHPNCNCRVIPELCEVEEQDVEYDATGRMIDPDESEKKEIQKQFGSNTNRTEIEQMKNDFAFHRALANAKSINGGYRHLKDKEKVKLYRKYTAIQGKDKYEIEKIFDTNRQFEKGHVVIQKVKANTKRKRPKGIYIESKLVGITASASNFLSERLDNSQHLYLVYADGRGNEKVIRGGVGIDAGILGGKIRIENNIPVSQSKDAYNGTRRFMKKLDVKEDSVETVWKKMSEVANVIDKSHIDYDNFGGKSYNSNSVIRTVLEESNIKFILPGVEEKDVPGWENNLVKYKSLKK